MRNNHWVMTATLGLLLTGCASMHTAPTPEARQTLAPTGKLRVAFLSTAPIYSTRDAKSGELKGVAVDLGKELARRIGIPFAPVPSPSMPALIALGKSGEWDVPLTGINPERAKVMDFSASFMEVELGYLVPKGSALLTLPDVDRPGIRIAVQEKTGADAHLSTNLKGAVLVRVSSSADAIELLKAARADAVAATKSLLFGASEKLPGSRVLEGRFTVEEIGIAVPRGRDLGAAYVRKFVEDAKSEGLVKAAIEKAGLRGVVVAPLQ